MTVQSEKKKMFMFLTLFGILWLIRVFCIPKTNHHDLDLVITVILKFLIFVVYPYLFVKFFLKDNPISSCKLSTDIKKGLQYGSVFSLAIVILGLAVYLILPTELKGLSLLDLFFAFIFAGFFEEFAFRGVILNRLKNELGFKSANMITATLFLLIHVPQYINNGTLYSQAAIQSFFFIFIWGIIDGILFHRSNSIWSTVIPHGVWDSAVHLLGF